MLPFAQSLARHPPPNIDNAITSISLSPDGTSYPPRPSDALSVHKHENMRDLVSPDR
jgi:hypothetical protein